MRLAPSLILALTYGCMGDGRDAIADVADGGADAGVSRPDAGADGGSSRPDAGPVIDAGSPSCTFGQDQTCNDDPAISALWGECLSDGTCFCHAGTTRSPSTGRCRVDGTPCGSNTCPTGQFCAKRVHSRDSGPPITWECMSYGDCTPAGCACALSHFASASCIRPICESDAPAVVIKCDDLN